MSIIVGGGVYSVLFSVFSTKMMPFSSVSCGGLIACSELWSGIASFTRSLYVHSCLDVVHREQDFLGCPSQRTFRAAQELLSIISTT